MAGGERKGDHQKLKMLYLAKIFSEETDDQHRLTMPQIIEKLAMYGANADRKTLYQDLDELRLFGMDIISEQNGRGTDYYLGSREFELPELKLLVDSVQAAKFMTDRKSQSLIKKLESLVSRYDAGKLHRQVTISGRVKTMNESIYYNVDKIHEAINTGVQIRFHYFQWNIRKEMELRRGGDWYQLSPWALMWDEENYYLVGYDAQDKKIKHYRVDKMLRITVTDRPREGEESFRLFNMPRYAKSLFGMFHGEEATVTLEAVNSMAGVIIDRFGKDTVIYPSDTEHFRVHVDVAVSPQFLGWVMSMNGLIRIVSPETVVKEMREMLNTLVSQYPPEEEDGQRPDIRVIPYEEKYRDDLLFMVLQAKNALGRVPGLNSDLLDVGKNYLEKGDMFWLALDGKDRVIGSVGCSAVPGTAEAEVHRLFIKPDRKRQGIGTLLLRTAEDYAAGQGKKAVRIHLGTPAEQWAESRSFYPKHGYRETEPGHMRKEL